MKNIDEMTILELRTYVNSLEFDELTEFIDTFDRDEIDPMSLLDASRLYDYLQYKQGGKLDIQL